MVKLPKAQQWKPQMKCGALSGLTPQFGTWCNFQRTKQFGVKQRGVGESRGRDALIASPCLKLLFFRKWHTELETMVVEVLQECLRALAYSSMSSRTFKEGYRATMIIQLDERRVKSLLVNIGSIHTTKAPHCVTVHSLNQAQLFRTMLARALQYLYTVEAL